MYRRRELGSQVKIKIRLIEVRVRRRKPAVQISVDKLITQNPSFGRNTYDVLLPIKLKPNVMSLQC